MIPMEPSRQLKRKKGKCIKTPIKEGRMIRGKKKAVSLCRRIYIQYTQIKLENNQCSYALLFDRFYPSLPGKTLMKDFKHYLLASI
jgi:hypothetical protein